MIAAQNDVFVSYNPRKEPKRGESRVRMRVTNPRCARLQLGENVSVPIGTHEIEVWAHEVPGVLERVEPDQSLVKQAFTAYERGLAKTVTDRLPQFKGKTLAQLRELAPTSLDLAAELEAAEDRTGDSPQARFRALLEDERDMLPLDSAEVLESGLPEKSDAAAVEGQQQLAKIIGEAVATALAAKSTVDDDRIKTAVREALAAERAQRK